MVRLLEYICTRTLYTRTHTVFLDMYHRALTFEKWGFRGKLENTHLRQF